MTSDELKQLEGAFFSGEINAKRSKARIKINKLLEKAGWRFFSDEGKANIPWEISK